MKKFLAVATTFLFCVTLASPIDADAAPGFGPPDGLGFAAGYLAWNYVDGADGFNVYLDNRYVATVTDRTYKVTKDGTYYVTAFDKDTSPTTYSTKSSTLTIGSSNLEAPEFYGYRFNILAWNDIEGADGYNVYRDNRYIATVSQPYYQTRAEGEYYVTAFDRDTSPIRFSTRSNSLIIG